MYTANFFGPEAAVQTIQRYPNISKLSPCASLLPALIILANEVEPNASTQKDISIESRHGAFPPVIIMSSGMRNYTPRPLKFE